MTEDIPQQGPLPFKGLYPGTLQSYEMYFYTTEEHNAWREKLKLKHKARERY